MIYHRAGYILDENFKFIENSALAVKDNLIVDIIKDCANLSKSQTIDHGPGVLIPGLVNGHCHLELSFLKSRLDYSKGFKDWVEQLILIRENTPLGEIKLSAKKELKNLISSGTYSISDISSIEATKDIFLDSMINGYFFYEELGNDDKFLKRDFKKQISFAAHAPHTTSPEVIKKIKKHTLENSLPFSIHCGESMDENLFIRGKNRDWEEFLKIRWIDYSKWSIPSNSSVEYLDKLGVIDDKTLLVHLLDLSDEDLETIQRRKSSICVCPRSNLNLHKRLPDIDNMNRYNINICLGTDSLASCESLDIFDEMKFIYENYKIDSKSLLKMATINGAKALLIDDMLGSLKVSKKALMVYLEIDGKDKFESIIFSSKSKRKTIL